MIISVYSFFFLFYSHSITCSVDTPSQKYAILSLSWLYAVTGIICTATFPFFSSLNSQCSYMKFVIAYIYISKQQKQHL